MEMVNRLVWIAGNGFRLRGRFCYPDSRRRFPAVLLLHGWKSAKEGSRHERLSKELVALGFATLAIDFRGHGKSEGDISNVSVKTQAEDIRQAVDFLCTRKKVDPKRGVAMVGASIGASSALYALSLGQHPVSPIMKCAVLIAPRSDFAGLPKNMYCFGEGGARVENFRMLKDGQDIDFYREARCVKQPVLVLHGENDEFISMKQSKKLIRANQLFRLQVIAGAPHVMRDKHLDDVIRQTVKFITGQFKT